MPGYPYFGGSEAGVAGQMPYDALVDAARGGASDFGGGALRELSKQEKLMGTLGALESFFGRLSSIGNPRGPDQGGIEHGQQLYQQAMAQRQQEAQGEAMQQAAGRRAMLEQQQQAQAQAMREEQMAMQKQAAAAQMFDRIAPDLGEQVMGPGEMGPPSAGPPAGAIAHALRSGDLSDLARFYQPGRGEARKSALDQERALSVQRESNKGAMEREQLSQGEATKRARIAADAAGNKRETVNFREAKSALDTSIKQMTDQGAPPNAILDSLKDFAFNMTNKDGSSALDPDAERYFRTLVARYSQAASPGAGITVGSPQPVP